MKRFAGIDRRIVLLFAAALLPALLLFLPVLQYSLTTPFALIDDYWGSRYVALFDSSQEFPRRLQETFLTNVEGRYRPLWELNTAVAWKVFGPTPWLHHLSRWVFHFAAMIAFVAAFLCVARGRREAAGSEETGTAADCGPARLQVLLPAILLVYVWLFFPNVPAARLGTSEVDTVFFMGLCNLAFALLLVDRHGGGIRTGRASLWLHGLFHLGCLGLSLSKEVNIAPLLWMSIAYGILLYVKGGRRWKTLLGAAPLACLFLFTLERVLDASGRGREVGYGVGYGRSWSIGQTLANEKALRTELFQIETSLMVTAGLVVLAAALLLAMTVRIFRSARGGARPGSDFFFVLFLLGQFASVYAVLSVSWGVEVRYWYPLVPCFAALLAFGVRFLLLGAGRASKALAHVATAGLAGFVLLFVSVNYHDFLYQTIVQHGLRQVEERLISTITRFLDEGQTVDILAKTAPEGKSTLPVLRDLANTFSHFLPRFHDRSYSACPRPSIDYAILGPRIAWRLRRRCPSFDWESPSWVVTLHEESALSGEERIVISPREDYRLLSWTGALAGVLQGTPAPRLHHDGGVHSLRGDHYRWIIYRRGRMEGLFDAYKSRLMER